MKKILFKLLCLVTIGFIQMQASVVNDATMLIFTGKSKEGYKLLEDAGNSGDTIAMNTLGAFYLTGVGGKVDIKKSHEWYLKGAKAGEPYSQIAVADNFANGTVVEKNLKKAFEWYLKAANQGSELAQYEVGKRYAGGIGVKQDFKKAEKYLLLSKKQNKSKHVDKKDRDKQLAFVQKRIKEIELKKKTSKQDIVIWRGSKNPYPLRSVIKLGNQIWENKAKGSQKRNKFTWYEAQKYCKNLVVDQDGFVVDNFRVPSVSELKRYQKQMRKLKGDGVRKSIPASLWSSQTHKHYSKSAYTVGMWSWGRGSTNGPDKTNKEGVVCISNGHYIFNKMSLTQLRKKLYKEQLKNMNKEQAYITSFDNAIHLKYGKPLIKHFTYNKTKEYFTITLGSSKGKYKHTFNVPVQKRFAPRYETMFKKKDFTPTVEFIVKGNSFKFKRITDIQDNSVLEEEERENAYGDIIGTKVFKEAKHINGLIWQDQPKNKRRASSSYYTSKSYCENLELLGVKGWKLPSIEDFKQLGSDMDKLTYRARSKRFEWYHSSNTDCVKYGSKTNCVQVVDITTNKEPYIMNRKKTEYNSVRCVLSPYKYNKYQKSLTPKYVEQGGFNGYLNAFKTSGKKEYIKKAYGFAKTTQEKSEVETALIENFGLDSIFEVTGKLSGNQGSGSNYEEENRWIVRALQSTGKAKVDLTVQEKDKPLVPLKYGQYKVKVNVKLELFYSLSGMGVSIGEKEVKEKSVWVELGFYNQFKDSVELDFGEIIQDARGSAIVSVSKKLKSIRPIITFEELRLVK